MQNNYAAWDDVEEAAIETAAMESAEKLLAGVHSGRFDGVEDVELLHKMSDGELLAELYETVLVRLRRKHKGVNHGVSDL